MRMSTNKHIQIDTLEPPDYFGHLPILNYDSEVPASNTQLFIYSSLPSVCLKVHENDILALPKRVQQNMKEYAPPYPEEEVLVREY